MTNAQTHLRSSTALSLDLTRVSPAELIDYRRQIADFGAAKEARERLEEARRDLAAVRKRCFSFAGFVKEAWPILEPETPLVWNWHMDAICQHLEAITRGRLHPRLIINVPPGSSKSLLVSVLWQAWEWGPCGMRAKRFLTAAYEEGNAKRDTRKTRDLILSEWYQMLWPEVRLVRTGELSFANDGTGTREGVPFDSLMGKRGDRVVIDDPHSLKQAESDTERPAQVRRFLEGGLNRLNDMKKSAIVIVMQRVHEADLSGALLALNIGFEHLMIPMEYEPSRAHTTAIGWKDPRTYLGQLMDPARVDAAENAKLHKLGDYMYAGQYQQRPAPREGGLFDVSKIEIVAAPTCRLVACARGWDLAASKGATSPYSAGALLAEGSDGYLYLLDVDRLRGKPFDVEERIAHCAAKDGLGTVQDIPQDPGAAGVAWKHHMAQKLGGMNFRMSVESGSKLQRAIPISNQVEAGMVRAVKGPWLEPFIDEARNFPNSTYKDQIDALSRAYASLLRRRADPAGALPEATTATASDIDDDLDLELEDDWP